MIILQDVGHLLIPENVILVQRTASKNVSLSM